MNTQLSFYHNDLSYRILVRLKYKLNVLLINDLTLKIIQQHLKNSLSTCYKHVLHLFCQTVAAALKKEEREREIILCIRGNMLKG